MSVKGGEDVEGKVIEQKAYTLLQEAIKERASDVHFVPTGEQYTIYFQTVTTRRPIDRFPIEYGKRLIAHFKFLSRLDVTESRSPQSGAFERTIDEKTYDVRLSTLPAFPHESAVLRIQLQEQLIPLERIAWKKKWYESLVSILRAKQGLFLVTGATGTGKTTTLYAMADYAVRTDGRHVMTLEDPIERRLPHLLQVEVNDKRQFGYEEGLRAMLRHVPDVIVLGEIREEKVAHTAVRAALTGHLVLATVHSSSLDGILYRMLDFGISFELLRQTMLGGLTQTLHCKGDHLRPHLTLLCGHSLTEAFQRIERRTIARERTVESMAFEQVIDTKRHRTRA